MRNVMYRSETIKFVAYCVVVIRWSMCSEGWYFVSACVLQVYTQLNATKEKGYSFTLACNTVKLA